jgi:hypothetical protein
MPADEEPKLAWQRLGANQGDTSANFPTPVPTGSGSKGRHAACALMASQSPGRDSPSCQIEAEANTNAGWRQFVTSFARRTAGLYPLAAARRCVHAPRGDRQDVR